MGRKSKKIKIKNWGKVKKALPFVCVVCSERKRDERQDPASYSTCQTEWNVVTRQGRKGSFIKVCRITLTRDKRPEQELHYATPSLRELCQDTSKEIHFSVGATIILNCRKPLPFKYTLYL